MAEYLLSTVSQLEELGLRDRHLWQLPDRVAERIETTMHRNPLQRRQSRGRRSR